MKLEGWREVIIPVVCLQLCVVRSILSVNCYSVNATLYYYYYGDCIFAKILLLHWSEVRVPAHRHLLCHILSAWHKCFIGVCPMGNMLWQRCRREQVFFGGWVVCEENDMQRDLAGGGGFWAELYLRGRSHSGLRVTRQQPGELWGTEKMRLQGWGQQRNWRSSWAALSSRNRMWAL